MYILKCIYLYVLVRLYFCAIDCILYLVYLFNCLSVCLSVNVVHLYVFYRLRHVSDFRVLCLRSLNKYINK